MVMSPLRIRMLPFHKELSMFVRSLLRRREGDVHMAIKEQGLDTSEISAHISRNAKARHRDKINHGPIEILSNNFILSLDLSCSEYDVFEVPHFRF